MVTFDIAKGNPGALTFIMNAYDIDPFGAEFAFSRMEKHNIVGSDLYILWNDCCGRDDLMALEVMQDCSIDYIEKHINKGKARGIKIDITDLLEGKTRSE